MANTKTKARNTGAFDKKLVERMAKKGTSSFRVLPSAEAAFVTYRRGQSNLTADRPAPSSS